MAKGFKHGGSSPLNFKVVGNPQPSNPKENTIWINTDVKITGYDFNATQPTNPTEGMVWICTNTVSQAAFNALKKNGLQVYPISAKQYIGGAWVNKSTKSYQGGAWVEWAVYLYSPGNEHENITGGWVEKRSAYTACTVEKTSEGMIITKSGSSEYNYATQNLIDLSNYSVMAVEYEITSAISGTDVKFGVFTSFPSVFSGAIITKAMSKPTNGKTIAEVDISSVNSGYVGIGIAGSDTGTIKIYNVWLR